MNKNQPIAFYRHRDTGKLYATDFRALVGSPQLYVRGWNGTAYVGASQRIATNKLEDVTQLTDATVKPV